MSSRKSSLAFYFFGRIVDLRIAANLIAVFDDGPTVCSAAPKTTRRIDAGTSAENETDNQPSREA